MSQPAKWVVCTRGEGRLYEDGKVENGIRRFNADSVGTIEEERGDHVVVWLIGPNEKWAVPRADIQEINVAETGDRFERKICNICHCLLPVSKFARNQNNQHGAIRRPSCLRCRTDIDKRAPKSGQAKRMEKERPAKGSPFKCPICQKRSIAGITAKIVADHDHHTGNIRDFICDSCNTGLGRFKNGENYLHNAIAYLKERDVLNASHDPNPSKKG